jgi:hypothetical protein
MTVRQASNINDKKMSCRNVSRREKQTLFRRVTKFPAFLCNPQIHYPDHNNPPFLHIQNLNKSNYLPPILFEIHSNIILPPKPTSSRWSFYFRLPHQNPVRISLLPYTRYTSGLSHPPSVHPNSICRRNNSTDTTYQAFSKPVKIQASLFPCLPQRHDE